MLFSMVAGAATKQYSRNLTPFAGVDISGPFQVSLVRGSEYRALLSVEEAYIDYVVCSVSGSVLTLSLDERKVPSDVKKQFRGRTTPDPVFSAVIYVPDLLQSVTMSGKAVLQDTEDLFDKSRITFDLKGSSTVKTISLSSLLLKVNMQNKASADIRFVGKECQVETANTAVLKISEESEKSRYSLSGGSKVTASSRTGSLSVHTKANCNMTLKGVGDSALFDISGTSEVDASAFEVPDAIVNMSSVCKLSEAAYRTLKVNLNGGSTLLFSGDPSVTIESIKSATMTRTGGSGNLTRL